MTIAKNLRVDHIYSQYNFYSKSFFVDLVDQIFKFFMVVFNQIFTVVDDDGNFLVLQSVQQIINVSYVRGVKTEDLEDFVEKTFDVV